MNHDAAVHALLALCARHAMPAALLPEVVRRAARIENWDALLAAAERHGLAPLVRAHLVEAEAPIPPVAERKIAALFLQHRRANSIRLKALIEILEALDADGIDVRVLKGPALMSSVYGDPALRPISDLDLLVPKDGVLAAQEILRDLGFRAREPASSLERHHHLPAAVKTVDGIEVLVELHHNALSHDHGIVMALGDRNEAPMAIEIAGRRALALGPHDMLRHLSLHLVGPLPRPLRLVWVADILGLAEVLAERLDWTRIAARDPQVLNVLALAGSLTPLPEPVVPYVPRTTIASLPPIADDPAVWSWVPPRHEPGGHWMRMRRSLNPPDWWLALRYGRDGKAPRWLLHLFHLRALLRIALRRAPMGFAEAGPR